MPDEFRDYLLVKRFGWTYAEIQDAPGVWLDWMVALDEVFEAERRRRS